MLTAQHLGLGLPREQEFRRSALLYFLPLVILNFLAGTRVMASSPGLLPNEHYLGLIFAALLTAAGIWLWRDASRVLQVSYFMSFCLAVFFLYRETSLLYGPASRQEHLSIFMPLYGYHAVLYFSFFVFLPRHVAEKSCWLVWAGVSILALARMVPEWDHFSTRQGAPDLLIFLLVANPMFILLGRVLIRLQELLLQSETEVERSRRELDLMDEITRSQERFGRAVSGSRDGLWEWCADEEPHFWLSPQVAPLLGMAPESLPDTLQELSELIHSEDRKDVIVLFEEARRNLDAFEVDCAMRTGSGEYQWFAIKGVASRSTSGSVHVSGSLRSIQKRREAEQKLRATNEALSQFAAVAAHDLKSPIHKIGSYAQLMRNKLGGQAALVEKQLAAIKRLSANMLELIERLLSYAAADSATPASEISMHAVIQDVLEVLEGQVAERNAQVQVGDMPVVWSNAGDLRQVFQNLIGNALKFCEQTPHIQIYAQDGPIPSMVDVVVEDNGIGIEAQYLADIRKPLTRLHSISEYEGFGLGLATVIRIVERNRGTLEIESTLGVGSRFIVRLRRQEPSGSDSA